MSGPMELNLAAEPASAATARRFVREQATLDSMRHTEADLLVTELVGNVVRHSQDAQSFVLRLDYANESRLRVAVEHESPKALVDPVPGVGFTLLERIARSWGHYFDDGRLGVWFTLRTPGTVTIPAELSDEEVFSRMPEDPAACSDELLRRHRDLALSIARRYRGKGIPDEDLEQVALMGLLRAIQRYDPELGALRPYAAVTISGEMKKLLRDRGWSVRVPRSVQQHSLEVSRITEELAQKLNRAPEVGEIASQLGMTEEEVEEAMKARMAYTSGSLEKPADGANLLSRLEEMDIRLNSTEDRLLLQEAISGLPQQQRTILHLRFNEDMTQSEIAEIVGISQMHVSRLLARAIETIRGYFGEEIEPPPA